MISIERIWAVSLNALRYGQVTNDHRLPFAASCCLWPLAERASHTWQGLWSFAIPALASAAAASAAATESFDRVMQRGISPLTVEQLLRRHPKDVAVALRDAMRPCLESIEKIDGWK